VTTKDNCALVPLRRATEAKADDFPEGKEVPKNSCSQNKKEKKMLAKNSFRYQTNITIEDECVDLQFGGREFSFDLNEDGLPLFPQWVKNKLPAFVPKTLEKMIIQMRKDDAWEANFYLDVEHVPPCVVDEDDQRRFGILIRCRCNPVLHEPEIRDYLCRENSKLTCAVCDESTTGLVGGSSSFEEWEQWGVYKGNRRVRDYWSFCGDKYKRWICDDCLNTFHGYTYDVYANTPDLKALERKNPQSQSAQGQDLTETFHIDAVRQVEQMFAAAKAAAGERKELAKPVVPGQGATEGQAGGLSPLCGLNKAEDNLKIGSRTARKTRHCLSPGLGPHCGGLVLRGLDITDDGSE
jgi:hypothetical protein